MPALFEVSQLTLDLGGRRLLEDIALTVASGELHVLLGANGDDKSSLAYALMGCAGYQSVSGRIWFDGEHVTTLSLHERARRVLALAWQEPARFEGLTHAADRIDLCERVHLNGTGARGLVKSRVAVEDEARAHIVGAIYGNAAGVRGHVDCMEIVRGNAVASAVPEVKVTHPQAKVTHEAAIGAVDERQLEALMARGLAPEDAVDRIILGLLG
jgi:ABC-type uncharacterized transport system ATPase subunit